MEAAQPNRLSSIASVAIFFMVVIIHYALSGISRQFDDVFKGFGAELPSITAFLVESPFYFWIAPTLLLLGMLLHHFSYIGRRSILFLSSVGTVISIFVCIAGLYYPIIQLNSAAS